MHDQLWNEAKEKVLDVANCEAEVGPVVSPFQGFQAVSLKRDVAIEVHLVERLHGNGGPAIVLLAVLGFMESQIVFDWLAREFGFLVLARQVIRADNPEHGKDGQVENDREEDEGLEAAAEFPGHVARDQGQERNEQCVGERVGSVAICWQWSIVNSRGLV